MCPTETLISLNPDHGFMEEYMKMMIRNDFIIIILLVIVTLAIIITNSPK